VDQRADHRLRARRRDLGAEEHTGERLIAHREHPGVEGLRIAPRASHRDAPPAVREALHAPGEDAAPDRVDDEIDAAPPGELAYAGDPGVGRIGGAVAAPEALHAPAAVL